MPSPPHSSADGQIISDPDGVRARWGEYFEQLFQVEPQTSSLEVGDVVVPLPNPQISKELPSLTEFREAISKL